MGKSDCSIVVSLDGPHPLEKSCHHLLTFVFFQSSMTFFLLGKLRNMLTLKRSPPPPLNLQ